MAYLTFRYGAVIPLVFTAVNSYFIRNTSNTKDVSIPYTNGNGQVLTAGQVLYTTGTVGTEGYLQVESKINQTLTSSGDLQTVVYHYPISTQANYVLNFNFEGAPISIGMYYNSVPVTGDVIFEKYNRVIHTFAVSDFVFSDYDGDEVTELAIFGDVTGYEYSGTPYVSGTWISMFDINGGILKYNPADQDTYYEKVNQYKVKDSEGNISS